MIIDSGLVTGSLQVIGNTEITGSLKVTEGITGSLNGNADTATSASHADQADTATNALTASYLSGYVSPFPFTGSAIVSGSLIITGSTASSQGFTGSLQGNADTATSASYAANTTSASYAANATSSSYSINSTSASHAISANSAISASSLPYSGLTGTVPTWNQDTTGNASTATSASYAANATSASYALSATTSSYAINADTVDGIHASAFVPNSATSSFATQTYVNTAVSNLVDSAPGTLDTLNELAAALGDDPNFATTVATSIGTKQAQLNGTGFVKVSGTTVSYDNNTYYSSSNPSGFINSNGSITGNAATATSASYAATATSATSATTAGSSTSASYATTATSAASATTAGSATSASYALNATSAVSATTSTTATSASYALNATSATSATSATTAVSATSSSYALNSTNAASATSASYALSASYARASTSASYALSATSAASATTAGSATSASYATTATSAGSATTSTSATSASYALNATNAASATTATSATSASYATTAQTLLGSVTSASYAANTSETLATVTGRGATTSTAIGAPNFYDVNVGSYNVNLGSGGSEGRGLVAGYSGGSYGGIGYNVRHTTTGGSWIAPGTDTSTYLLFSAGGFSLLGAGSGTAGRTLSYNTLANINSGGIYAPIYYEISDTGYYLNPGDASRIRKTDIVAIGAGWLDALNLYSSDTTNKWSLLPDAGASNSLRFAYNTTERFRIDTNGVVNSLVEHRSPIFYDSANTSYYLDPSSTSYSSYNAGGARFRNIEISNATYTDTIQNVTSGGNIWINYGHNGNVGLAYGGGNVGVGALSSPSYTFQVYNNSDVWHSVVGGASGQLRIGGQTGSGAVIQAYTPAGSVRDLYIQRDGGNMAVGFSTASYKLDVNGNIRAYGSNLVLDFTGNVGGIQWGVNPYISGVANGGFEIRDNTNGASRLTITSGGSVTALTDMRSPIFYDSNNTGYYIDPASTSYLNVLSCANVVNGAFLGVSNTSNSSGNGISLYNGGGSGQPTYGLMFGGTPTFGTHGSVSGDWATYFTMNDDSSRGWIFKRGTTNVASFSGGGILQTSGYMYSSTYVQSGQSMYSPIYYDANDSAYYTDPNSATTSARIAGSIFSDGAFGSNGHSSGGVTSRVFAPKGAAYSYTPGTVTGAIKIRLPNRANDTMWSMKVRIYNYQTNQTAEYLLGNYSYSAGAYNYSATYLGGESSAARTVRFGNEGGYDCVWIGETSTVWTHPVVSVMDFMGGYSNGSAGNWNNGWEISLVTSFGTVAASQTPNIRTANAYSTTTSADSAMYSPIFYDSNDTAYYTNPASTSNLYDLQLTGNKHTYLYINPGNGNEAMVRFNGGAGNTWYIGKRTSTGINSTSDIHFYSDAAGADVFGVTTGGIAVASGDMRAPIFYDNNNTGYYSDPASTSNLNAVVSNTSTVNNGYSFVSSGYNNNGGFAMNNAGTYWGLMWNYGTNDWRIGIGSTIAQNTWNLRWDNGGNVWINSSIRASIYYDQDDTGYYTNPAGDSNMSAVYANNWFRARSDCGLYTQDYGGHFRRSSYASHGTWEIFGYNKGGYAGINIYDAQGYNNNYMHESGNGGLYQENGNGWIFYHSRGNGCLGVMTSTTSSSYKLYVPGGIYATGDIVAYSDRRKKENIVTIDNALEKVRNLRGVYYDKIDEPEKGRRTGVIAQEIEEVLPEVVTYAEDTDEYGVSYGNIVGVLIEAIKEQQTQIDELKQLVKQLTNK